MKLTRLDAYQSWLIEDGDARLILDPWLEGDLSLPPGSWMFHRKHEGPKRRSPKELLPIDGLLLSAHFGDHFHRPTLTRFPRSIPCVGSKVASRFLSRLGFENITPLGAGKKTQLSNVVIEGVAPGFPYRHNSIGFLLTGLKSQKRVYLETHTIDPKCSNLFEQPPDAVVAPTESVRLFGVPLCMGPQEVVERLKVIRPPLFLPTGLEPQKATGFLASFLRTGGSIDACQASLNDAGLKTELIVSDVGEAVVV